MLCDPPGGFFLHLGKHPFQNRPLFFADISGQTGFPPALNGFQKRKQLQCLLCRIQLHDALVLLKGCSGNEAVLLQNGRLPRHIAFVDADDGSKLVLRDAGIGTDLAGMTGFETHGRQRFRAVLGTAAGNLGNIADDLRHGTAS